MGQDCTSWGQDMIKAIIENQVVSKEKNETEKKGSILYLKENFDSE